MPIKVRAIGEEVSLMRIGRRQLRLRGPRKRDKPLIVFKSKSVPSRTEYWLEAALCLAKAARDMRGRSLEEVIANVIKNCSGKRYVPERVKELRKQARHDRADANIKRMEEELRRIKSAKEKEEIEYERMII